MSDTLDVKEFLAGYLAEADEHLQLASRHLLAIEAASTRGEPQPRAVRELFRSLHTLKGLSAMVNAEPIVNLAHEMESVLRAADRAGGKLSAAAIDVLLRGVRAISDRVTALGRGLALPAAPRKLLEELAAVTVRAAPTSTAGIRLTLPAELEGKLSASERQELAQGLQGGKRVLRVDFLPSAERAAQGITITTVRERVATLGTLVKVLPRSLSSADGKPAGVAFVLLLVTEADDAAVTVAASAESIAVIALPGAVELADDASILEGLDDEAGPRSAFIRVDIARLDAAFDHLAELVVSRARLQRACDALAARGSDVRELTLALREHGRQVRDLRAAIMHSRMVKVAETLERSRLVLRGLMRGQDKQVTLVLEAGDLELDKAVADRLGPVILHLVRNAFDHAMESPTARRAAGKDETGTIAITCRQVAGNRLELTVRDDGHGIDAAQVARRARAALPASNARLLELLAQPGLTTLDQVTHTSGRGLGMDIVRRTVVNDLGGELLLEDTSPAGSAFVLRVPLSVTIIDVFTLQSGGQTYVVPAGSVEELVELDPASVMASPDLGQRHGRARLYRHRGGELPLYPLAGLLGLPGEPGRDGKAVIVRSAGHDLAFQVDRVLGRQEIVVRPVHDPLVRLPGVAGTTDLGDGAPTLVLDLMALLSRAQEASPS